ncbi:MAG TPA: helix-turn-helix transcriptional regulator [Pedobacter sp.]|nr:helix-turn-helix transcriptional regulator [Pedobacter sp.]
MISNFFKKEKLTRNELKNIGLGDDIRKYRNERCYSQEYLASQLGVTQSTYQRIESGAINITFERLNQIAKILRLPTEVFLEEGKNKDDVLVFINKSELDTLRETLLLQRAQIEQMETKLNSIQFKSE